MMIKRRTLSLLVALVPATILWVSCSPDHSDHASTTDHGSMDHSEMDHSAMTHGAVVSADGVKSYPLSTCVVSGEELGSMGDPVSLVHEGQEMKFCCKNCVKDFQADPDKYLAALAEQMKVSPGKPMDMKPAEGEHAGHQN